jgi:cellulose synthase/poly-beta-1,6-N-acetylglucosamine synthase-like glycosyltransferase
MAELFFQLLGWVYFGAVAVIFCYGINCYVMVALFARKRRTPRPQPTPSRWPVVTTQIAVYNELNVVERALAAACRMEYPPGRHEIQILDDSTDETSGLIDRLVRRQQHRGVDVAVLRRRRRTGFKAGALAAGLQKARGELVAVFDADFVPPPDFLLKTVAHFEDQPGLGLVQTRWGHLNRRQSLLTRAQSVGIDGHFMVEQAARDRNGLFMNFNGTAGIWRRRAIEAAGGWQWDTLTEDMDLSYRMQLTGWQTLYLPDVVVPAEIPEDVSAFKSQQFRWAKGSIQTAVKLMPSVGRAPVPLFHKLQAFFHMTHYLVHPCMVLLSLLALPVLLTVKIAMTPVVFSLLAAALCLSLTGPNTLYVVSQRAAYDDWQRRLLALPALVLIGVGVAVSNTRAVLEALLGIESAFVRTPKRGRRQLKAYRVEAPWPALAELLLGIYCGWSLSVYLSAGKWLVGPFLALYTAAFLFTGALTIVQNRWPPDRGAAIDSQLL